MAYVNASKNAGLNPNRRTKRKPAEYINAASKEKNTGGILAGTGYVLGQAGLGLGSVVEGITDVATAGGDLIRGDVEMAKYRFKDNATAQASQKLRDWYNPNKVMQVAGDVASGIGNSVTFMIPYAGPWLAATGYAGMGISSAAEKTGDVGAKEIGYGLVTAGQEFLLDKFVGGAGRAAKNIGASVTRKLGREAAEAGAKATAKLAGKSFGKAVAIEALKGAGGEAAEEAISEAIDPYLQKLFGIDPNAETSLQNIAYAGFIGALSGGLMTAGPAAINYKNSVSTGKEIRTNGETEDFLEHTRLVLNAAKRKKVNSEKAAETAKTQKEAYKAAKKEGNTETQKPNESVRKNEKAAKRVEKMIETVENNMTAYEKYYRKADKTAKELEISDAILGEMRGNVFLLENAATLEVYEEAILELGDDDLQELVNEINEEAKAAKQEKTDYTVADLKNNLDDILTMEAGRQMMAEAYGADLFRGRGAKKAEPTDEETAQSGQKAPQKAQEEKGEQIPDQEQKPAQRRYKGEGRVRIEGDKKVSDLNLKDDQYTAYKAAEILAPALGVDIELSERMDLDGRQVNGVYYPDTNTIKINVNAERNGKKIALYTLGHELTHYVKSWSAEKYQVLEDFVAEKMGKDFDNAVNAKETFLKKIGQDPSLAREEVVADGMELILTDGKVLEELAHTDRSLWQKIKAWFQNIAAKIRKYYGELNQASKTAQTLRETVETLDEVERLFTEAAKAAGESAREAEKGVIIDETSGTALLSVDDIPKNQAEVDEAVDRLVNKLGVDRARAENWVKAEISLATLILRDDMVDYAHRKADRRLTAIVKNSDYKQGTLDFSNICRKRREYTRMMQRIQQEFPNRRFTAEEFATIREIMVQEGLEVACGLCYVEDRRQNEGYIAESFQRAVESWRDGNRETFYDTKNEVDKAYSKGAAKAMGLIEKGDYVPTIADLTTVEGMERLQKDHNDLYRAWKGFNNARGMASARLLTGEAEYQRQILTYNKNKVKQINDLGGLRVFSFSDFEEFHLIDIIQAVQDCAAMGIKIQFYTKVPSFALLMKGTKAKGNLSLIPKGDLGYREENGRIILEYDPVEGINFNDPAFKAVARGNPNIGTILVGINEKQIRAAMEDDFIDYIIPFHTGQSTIVRQIKKIGKWDNYKDSQTDKPKVAGSKAKPVNVYTDVIAAAEREGTPIQNERQFVERFLRVCEERKLTPRFSQFLDKDQNGNYVYTKGYYKLLLDFKTFDKDGKYLPQEPVVPEFDEDLLKDLTKKYVAGEKAKAEQESPAFNRALKRITEEVVSSPTKLYSVEEDPFQAAVRRMEEREGITAKRSPKIAPFRQKLAEALESMAESSEEYWVIKSYSESIERLDGLQREIGELNEQAASLRDIQFNSPDEAERSDAAKELQKIYEQRNKLEAELAKGDSKIAKLRQSEPIRNLMKAASKTAKEEAKTEEKYRATRREMTVRERTARRVIGRLNTMFYSPSKSKHVPADLQEVVEKVLRSDKLSDYKAMKKNLREMVELESDIEQLERLPTRTASEEKRLQAKLNRYAELEGEDLTASNQAAELYAAFKTWLESKPESQIDRELLSKLEENLKKIQDMPLSQMSVESLAAVEDFYKMLYHQINTVNNTFSTERTLHIDELGSKAADEVRETKSLKFLSPKGNEWAAKDGIRKFFWKNMKPLTVFEAIGSGTFRDLFTNVLNGEEVWAQDILEAREKILEAREKHKYKEWDFDERTEVKTNDGTVAVSLGERMALYAYSFREQAKGHLRGGGFVLDPRATSKDKVLSVVEIEKRLNNPKRYAMDDQMLAELAKTLTADQRAYVEEMQKYLTNMGQKGNQVSRKLYGIDLFKEEYYFPIKVKSEYLASHTGKSGDPNIKNRGMTKEVQPNAQDPMVLMGFDDVMVDHINSMSTYHAFVLPIEDLVRVLNYKPVNYLRDADGNVVLDENGMPKADAEAEKDFSTLKAVIESKYGAEASRYIEQLIRDLNGGARRDAAAGLIDRGITAFKRASTMASLSVLVQQPTSLFRAGAYIDAKYLYGNSKIVDFKNHKELWEKVKKYAPVAVIKEMGGYDTGVGTRTGDYLNAAKYGKGERFKGFLTDATYRAEVFGMGAAYADEMAWIQMFEACVSEQADKLGKSRDSEEVLKAAGERFTEVVRHTQVYDSTLSRSEYMRSKDTGAKMATAFMAEPTTVVSMVAEAIMRGERGDKKFVKKTAAAVAGAIIMNSLAASIIYALRDDDEEKTFTEKYISSVIYETADSFNPMGYFPIARDILSIMQGYEVERADMTLIQNLMDQVDMITSSKRSVLDKVFGVSGAVSAFFGVPVTNMYRDAKGFVNLFVGQIDTEKTTGKGISAAVKQEFNTILNVFDDQIKNENQLYRAAVSGDENHYNRVVARYKTKQEAEMALRQALRDNEPRIAEAAEARISGELEAYESIIDQLETEGTFDRNLIIRAVNNEINDINSDRAESTVPKADQEEDQTEYLYKTSDLNAALERDDKQDFADVYEYLINMKKEDGKTEAQAKSSVKASITSYWKKRYIEAWEANDTAEIKRIQAILLSTGLYGSRNDVAKMGQAWVKAYAEST